MRFGVVVPAWNANATIGDTLLSLARQEGVAADIVVVANGCTDRTCETARSWIPVLAQAGHTLRVIETTPASKPLALNAGEELLGTYPRAFIDADVRLSANALSAVARVLAGETPILAAPRLQLVAPRGHRTERIARLLASLPPFATDVVGGGFYAVNAGGRRRWGRFPELVADDAFVCSRFRSAERVLVTQACFAARFPSDAALHGVLTRWEAGRRQLERLGVPLVRTSGVELVRALVPRPDLWGDAVRLAWAKWRARRAAARLPDGRLPSWQRAD